MRQSYVPTPRATMRDPSRHGRRPYGPERNAPETGNCKRDKARNLYSCALLDGKTSTLEGRSYHDLGNSGIRRFGLGRLLPSTGPLGVTHVRDIC